MSFVSERKNKTFQSTNLRDTPVHIIGLKNSSTVDPINTITAEYFDDRNILLTYIVTYITVDLLSLMLQ